MGEDLLDRGESERVKFQVFTGSDRENIEVSLLNDKQINSAFSVK